MTTAGSPPGARVRPLFERAAPGRRPGAPPPAVPTLHGDRDGAPRPRPLFEPEEAVRGKEDEAPPPGPVPPRPPQSLFTEEPEALPEVSASAEAAAEEPGEPPGEAPPPTPVVDPYAELRAAQEEAEGARDKYLASLRELERVHAADFSSLENDLADVALEIARAIIMRELKTDRLYVIRLVEAALKVTVEDESANVLVSPQDLARVEQERPRLEAARGGGLIRVSADPALHPGDCLVQVGRARIDARLPDRIERVRQALHGVVTETE